MGKNTKILDAESTTFSTDPPYNFLLTSPEMLLRHDISDEELTIVSSGNRTFSQDVMWVALGAFLGALVPAISALDDFNNNVDSFNKWDLIECLVCFAALVVFVIMALMRGASKDESTDKVTEIRERTAKKVSNDQ